MGLGFSREGGSPIVSLDQLAWPCFSVSPLIPELSEDCSQDISQGSHHPRLRQSQRVCFKIMCRVSHSVGLSIDNLSMLWWMRGDPRKRTQRVPHNKTTNRLLKFRFPSCLVRGMKLYVTTRCDYQEAAIILESAHWTLGQHSNRNTLKGLCLSGRRNREDLSNRELK